MGSVFEESSRRPIGEAWVVGWSKAYLEASEKILFSCWLKHANIIITEKCACCLLLLVKL